MTKRRKNNKQSLFRAVHLQAVVFLLIYTVLSKYIFVRSIISESLYVVYFGPYLYGVIGGCVFLYLFSHEDFFHFIRDVENKERARENIYLKKYIHFGKLLATFIIAAIGGPIFSALTIRLLLNKFWYKYFLIAAGNIASTFITVGIGLGLWKAILLF